MRELAAEFIAKKQIVQRNQDDPVRESDDADQEYPYKNAANHVANERGVVLFCLRFTKRTWNQRSDDCSDRCQSVKPVVEYSESRRPTESVDTDHGNEIAREHGPCVGPRHELAQMLRE